MDRQRLISDEYLDSQRWLHDQPRGYGGKGCRWAAVVESIFRSGGYSSALDYGCGQASLSRALRERYGIEIANYDPAVPGFADGAEPCDLVICTDVLEHIEPDRVDTVLDHIADLATFEAFLVIATRPSNKALPDGRNAHLIVEGYDWWAARLEARFEISHEWNTDWTREVAISCRVKDR